MLSNIDFLARIVAAIIYGGLIGFERERNRKVAGFRTHILVCLGSALMTCLAVASSDTFDGVARIIAAIITGIGFLGAGNIIMFRDEHQIHGLTTAASIWVAAGIGIAVGLGYYLFGFIVSVAVVLVLMINDYRYIQNIKVDEKTTKKRR